MITNQERAEINILVMLLLDSEQSREEKVRAYDALIQKYKFAEAIQKADIFQKVLDSLATFICPRCN